MSWQEIWDWLATLEWQRLAPELIGKALGVVAGVVASWFLLFRRKFSELQKLKSGDSDDILFQAHYLSPAPGERVQLLFRTVASKLTIDELYDNPAVRDLVRQAADKTTLNDPVLPSQGKLAYEIINDAANFISGFLATAPHEKQVWLMCMTCEDRSIVRRRCIRCFLVRPEDLERFANWSRVNRWVMLEKPWHWFRVVALHRISKIWADEQARFGAVEQEQLMPLVDDQAQHRRLIPLALSISPTDLPIASAKAIDWSQHSKAIADLGIELDG